VLGLITQISCSSIGKEGNAECSYVILCVLSLPLMWLQCLGKISFSCENFRLKKKFNSGRSPASALTYLFLRFFGESEETMSLNCDVNLKNRELVQFCLPNFCGKRSLFAEPGTYSRCARGGNIIVQLPNTAWMMSQVPLSPSSSPNKN